MIAMYTHFSAVGKWPRALTALRIRALMLSIALVVQTTARILVSNCRNGPIALVGEEAQKILVPTPGRMPGPVDKEQRRGVRFAARPLVDHFEHLSHPSGPLSTA
jgi:hypothetical protein